MISFYHWHTEPLLIGSLLFVTWVYFVLIGPFRARVYPRIPYPKGHASWFVLTITTLYLTVGSPLDALGENFLFWAHMVQHNLLMYVAPVFLLLSLPPWLVDHVLRKSRWLERMAAVLVHPVTAGASLTLAFSIWHVPYLYELALHHKGYHALEHWTMFFPSVLVWWNILGPSRILPPLPYGVQLIFIFLLMVAQLPVFGVLTFSGDVLYPTYEFAPRVMDLSPLEDQVLGGVVMKVTNMIVSVILLITAFARWSASQQRAVAV